MIPEGVPRVIPEGVLRVIPEGAHWREIQNKRVIPEGRPCDS